MKPLFTLSKLLLALTVVLLVSLSANAQKIPFQGKLLENGEPVDGQKTLVFSIADPEWTETHENVQVTNGLYSLVLGSITELPSGLFDGVESLSLNVAVDGTALTPVEVYAPIQSRLDRIDYFTNVEGDNNQGLRIDQNVGATYTGNAFGALVTADGDPGSGGGDIVGLLSSSSSDNRLYNTGLWGTAYGNGNDTPESENYGVFGDAQNNRTNNYGVYGTATGGLKSYGVYGTAGGGSEENWAGYFSGDTKVTGDLTVDGSINGDIGLPDTVQTDFDASDTGLSATFTAVTSGDGGADNTALSGLAMAENGFNQGVYGEARSVANNEGFSSGVWGTAKGEGSGSRYGLRGDVEGTNSSFTAAVRGLNAADGAVDDQGQGSSSGGYFDTRGTGIAGASNFGVYGAATKDAGRNIGVYGRAQNGDSNYAGWFDGDIQVFGDNFLMAGRDWENTPGLAIFELRGTVQSQPDGNGNTYSLPSFGVNVQNDGLEQWANMGFSIQANDGSYDRPMANLRYNDQTGTGLLEMYSNSIIEFTNDNGTPNDDTDDFLDSYYNNAVNLGVDGDGMGYLDLQDDNGGYFRIDANGIGNLNLNGSSISDEGILNGQYFGGLNVGNDPNGNDPSGASGAFEIRGTNTLNARLMGQFWENADRPVLDLYGSHTDGGTWYWPNAVLDVQGDATNDWGSLRLYKSAEGENNHQEMITLEAEGGSGYFAGDLTVDGNINGNINLSSEAYALSEKDWENGTQGYLNLHGDNDPNTTQDSRRVALEVNGEGLANTTGSLNLFGPIYDDPNCTDCPRSFVSMNVQRDAGGNDPNGWNGYLELNGTTSPNVFIGARSYDSHDIPQIQLYGSKPDGNGWFYEQANFSTNLDGTQEWGSLVLRGNDGDHNIELGAKSWEDASIGARRPFLNMQGSINDDNLVWMEVYDTGDGNEAGSINFTSTDGAGFGMNAYGLTGTAQNIESNGFQIRGNQEVPDGGGGSFLPSLAAMGFNEGVSNGNAGWLALRNSDNGNEEVVTIYMDGENGSASFVGGKVSINSDGDNSPGDGELNLGSTDNSAGIRMYGKLDDGGGSRSHIALDGSNGNYVYLDGTGDIVASNSIYTPGNIDAEGNISSPNITALSDRRLKENILPLNKSLSKVMKLRGVSYNWINGKYGKKNQIGVIAQEVEEVYPEFVHTNEDGMKSVNYSQMVAVLIEAIKELNTKITTLETENASLKASLAEVDGLKSQMKNLETLVAKLVQNDAVTTTTQQQ